jgi:hypothetical protein
MGESVRTSYVNRDGVEKAVNFIRSVEHIPSGRELIVCDHEDYEVRLIPINSAEREGKSTKVIFNAQLRNKKGAMKINVPVVMITAGDHAGQIMIGRTAEYKKERALISHVAKDHDGNTMYDDAGKPKSYDDVTIPFSEYEVIRTIVDYNVKNPVSASVSV